MMVLLVKVTAIEVRLSASLSTQEVAGHDQIRPNGLSTARLACARGALAERTRHARSSSISKEDLPGHPLQGAAL